MTDQPLSQEMIDALLKQAGGGASEEPDADPGEAQADVAPGVALPVQPGEAVSLGGATFSRPAGPASEAPSVRPAVFSPLPPAAIQPGGSSIDLLLDVPLQVTVELGRTNLSVREVLGLGAGSVVELEKLAGEPVDLLVNNRLIARGEVVVIDESFGVRVTAIIRTNGGIIARR